MIKKHIEIRTVEHKGISITYCIDYNDKTIELVEKDMNNFRPKKWVFSGRGIEYMQEWKDVLDAMKFAIDTASKDLKEYINALNKEKSDLIINIGG